MIQVKYPPDVHAPSEVLEQEQRHGGAPLSACPVCGLVLAPTRSGSTECPNRWCVRADRWFSVVFSVGPYRGALRETLVGYKYRGERWRATQLAAALAFHLEGTPCWFEEFDLLTGVPSYAGTDARRPWDPVAAILGELSHLVGSGWNIAPGLVLKTRETPAMQGLGWAGRRAVAAGPLRQSLVVPDREVVQGARLLVLDDVMTEGSTLREVARALCLAGAAEVAGLVLARPVWVGSRAKPKKPKKTVDAGLDPALD